MNWLISAILSFGIGIALFVFANTTPWELARAAVSGAVADWGLSFVLFMVGLFYAPFLFGGFCIWKAIKTRHKILESTDAAD